MSDGPSDKINWVFLYIRKWQSIKTLQKYINLHELWPKHVELYNESNQGKSR